MPTVQMLLDKSEGVQVEKLIQTFANLLRSVEGGGGMVRKVTFKEPG